MDTDLKGYYELVIMKHACRLRYILHQLDRGDLGSEHLKKNLEYAATILEAASQEEEKKHSEQGGPFEVSSEVREWLSGTFTQNSSEIQKRRFRPVAATIRAGLALEKMYRSTRTMSAIAHVPAGILTALKDIDNWNFEIFTFSEITGGHAMKYIALDFLNRYNLLARYKIPHSTLNAFLVALEVGYAKHKNPYHCVTHGADVAQTTYWIMSQTGLMNWLTELELFACFYAALIHDYEHTGHTNNFHIQSCSHLALLYNDRAILENHHISATFMLLQNMENNILSGFTREQFMEFRHLVIEIVLATDMSSHFTQVKAVKTMLHSPDNLDRSKALSFVVHCCDISHPAKSWHLHHQWTMLLLEEFFRQGDLERSLGLPYSPLCDRNTTPVAESQLGFIDFIVEPALLVCGEMLTKLMETLAERDAVTTIMMQASEAGDVSDRSNNNNNNRTFRCNFPWLAVMAENKMMWKSYDNVNSSMPDLTADLPNTT